MAHNPEPSDSTFTFPPPPAGDDNTESAVAPQSTASNANDSSNNHGRSVQERRPNAPPRQSISLPAFSFGSNSSSMASPSPSSPSPLPSPGQSSMPSTPTRGRHHRRTTSEFIGGIAATGPVGVGNTSPAKVELEPAQPPMPTKPRHQHRRSRAVSAQDVPVPVGSLPMRPSRDVNDVNASNVEMLNAPGTSRSASKSPSPTQVEFTFPGLPDSPSDPVTNAADSGAAQLNNSPGLSDTGVGTDVETLEEARFQYDGHTLSENFDGDPTAVEIGPAVPRTLPTLRTDVHTLTRQPPQDDTGVIDLDSAVSATSSATPSREQKRAARHAGFTTFMKSGFSNTANESDVRPHRRADSAPSLFTSKADRPGYSRFDPNSASEKGFKISNVSEEDEDEALAIANSMEAGITHGTESNRSSRTSSTIKSHEKPANALSMPSTSFPYLEAGQPQRYTQLPSAQVLNALRPRVVSLGYNSDSSVTPADSPSPGVSPVDPKPPTLPTSGPVSLPNLTHLPGATLSCQNGSGPSVETPSLVSDGSTMASGANQHGSTTASPTIANMPSSAESSSSRRTSKFDWHKRRSVSSFSNLPFMGRDARQPSSLSISQSVAPGSESGTSSKEPKTKRLSRRLKFWKHKGEPKTEQ